MSIENGSFNTVSDMDRTPMPIQEPDADDERGKAIFSIEDDLRMLENTQDMKGKLNRLDVRTLNELDEILLRVNTILS